ncbi:MAG TPA: hypothetical protein P5110_07540 [Candidatus Omnitrophota bacterium]|nr:hypothetical protein [Candidatus Omnitrophota bacterium]
MANPSVTYTFSNSTTADATQVNSNFTDIINALTDGTKDITIGSLTVAGTTNLNGTIALGNASGDAITVTGTMSFSTTPQTDAIAEKTAAAGVTIDGALIKDGAFEGAVEGKCIDIQMIGNFDIVDSATDVFTFDFVPSKILIDYSTGVQGSVDDAGAHTRGQCLVTITGTNTFTSVLNYESYRYDKRAGVDNMQNSGGLADTTNVIYGLGGMSSGGAVGTLIGTGVWNTSAKTLTITWQETGTTTAQNRVIATATAYK